VSDDPQRQRAPDPTLAATLERLDGAWREFRSLVAAFPLERLGDPIGSGWTRKQMLAHISGWHESAADRLLAFSKTGKPQPLPAAVDVFNARVARAAIGRTSGEVVDSLDSSFSRLRRQLAQLDDAQLVEDEGWALTLVAENTYEHYEEHAAELGTADLSSTP
jgi:hypothetical protein